jgi:hypothetical protein
LFGSAEAQVDKRVISRLAIATFPLTIAACAQTSTSLSDVAQAKVEDGLTAFEHAAASSCPKTALRIAEAGVKEREAFESNSPAAIDQITKAMLALSEICKIEKESCGTGPARLGMTTDEAIHTSWCFPDKKNTTEIAGHFREQWVYGSRGYLYFDNGRLTAIQEQAP